VCGEPLVLGNFLNVQGLEKREPEIPFAQETFRHRMPPYASLLALQQAVIPAKAGIQDFSNARKKWIPAFAGMTALVNS